MMAGLFLDTDKATERLLIELTRQMPDWKKFQQLDSLISSARQFAMAGLRCRFPQATEEELKKRYAALVLDRETVMKVYGWDPEEDGYR